MLQLFGSGLISLWLDMGTCKPLDTLELLALLAALVSPSADPNPTMTIVQQYLQRLEAWEW